LEKTTALMIMATKKLVVKQLPATVDRADLVQIEKRNANAGFERAIFYFNGKSV
jgi:hypothetical protein